MQHPKMNWVIFLLLIIITISFTQERNAIAKSLFVQENKPKLLVDDGDGLMMGYADANLVMTNKYFGLKERLNSKRWHGYYGLKKMSEPRFFETAGFVLEANNAARYQSIRQGVFWTGSGLAFLGVLIGSIQFIKDGKEWKWGSQVLGIGLFVAGLGVDAIWYFSPPNRYSLGTALNAANKYNQKE